MKVGVGVEALHFEDGLGLFGFGPGGGLGLNLPLGAEGHDVLQARALYLEDGGQRALIVSFDAASGSRIVHRAILEQLHAEGVKLLGGQLWVVGTHTHSAPGHFLGNLYDIFAHSRPGYRADVAIELVEKGLAAARAAMGSVVDCEVGTATRTLWRAGRNRSLRPFLRNFDGDLTRWVAELESRNLTVPGDLAPEERALDPRLTVTAFVAKQSGRPIATWASWCCHAATLGPAGPIPGGAARHRQRPYHRDWPGVAVDRVQADPLGAPFAMMHQGANGDVTSLPVGLRRTPAPLARVVEIGERVGAVWASALQAAMRYTTDGPLEIGFASFDPRVEGLPTFEIGQSVMSGSEEVDPGLLTRMFGEAKRWPHRRSAQRPKLPALGPLQFLMRIIPILRPSPEHPIGLLRLGNHVRFASPFEIPTYAAWQSEQAIVGAWRDVRGETITASPMGLVGDYAGYVTTEPEYDLQHYEGGHTIYGRYQLTKLTDAWCRLVTPAPLDATARCYTRTQPRLTRRVNAILRRLAEP